MALQQLLDHYFVISVILSIPIMNIYGEISSNQLYCRPVPDEHLQRRLGDAFDAKYMSKSDPRRPNLAAYGPQLANLDSDDLLSSMRRHRRRHWKEPWSCETVPEILDLGPDHYPRYLTSKKCTSDRCFYGSYYCRPRTYSVNVLRRLSGSCVQVSPETVDSVPYELSDKDEPIFMEAWEFVKYNVVVYCECRVFPDIFPT